MLRGGGSCGGGLQQTNAQSFNMGVECGGGSSSRRGGMTERSRGLAHTAKIQRLFLPTTARKPFPHHTAPLKHPFSPGFNITVLIMPLICTLLLREPNKWSSMNPIISLKERGCVQKGKPQERLYGWLLSSPPSTKQRKTFRIHLSLASPHPPAHLCRLEGAFLPSMSLPTPPPPTKQRKTFTIQPSLASPLPSPQTDSSFTTENVPLRQK